jgi:hypothetical protein
VIRIDTLISDLVHGDIPVLHYCCAGSRPATALLAAAPSWTISFSINLNRTTPVLPTAIGPPSSPPLRRLPKQAVNAHRQYTAAAEIPIAPDAPLW